MADQSKLILDLSYAVSSDVGLRRTENQDSYKIIQHENFTIFLVADGMGGAQGGKCASQMAVDLFEEAIRQQQFLSKEIIEKIVLNIHQSILEKSKEDPDLNGMGTTLVGLIYDRTNILYLNVGDSRLYFINDSEVTKLTKDHTVVQELLNSGAISEEQAKNHPVSHMLTRSLGASADLVVDISELHRELKSGDKFLLCSDGLHGPVDAQEIQNILNSNALNEAVAALVSLANQRGGKDNVTVLAVRVDRSESSQQSELEGRLVTAKKIEGVRFPKNVFIAFGTTLSLLVIFAVYYLLTNVPLSKQSNAGNDSQVSKVSATVSNIKKQTALTPVQNKIPTIVSPVANSEATASNFPMATATIMSTATYSPVSISTGTSVVQTTKAAEVTYSSFDKSNQHMDEALRAADLSLQKYLQEIGSEIDLLLIKKQYLESDSAQAEGQLAQLLKQKLEAEQSLDDLLNQKAEIDAQYLKLAALYDQRDTMDSLDLIKNMLPYSSKIRELFESYNSITRDYLRAIEEKKIRDADPQVEANLQKLLSDRNRKLYELKLLVQTELEAGLKNKKKQREIMPTIISERESEIKESVYKLEQLRSLDSEFKILDAQQKKQKLTEIDQKIAELKGKLSE